MIAKGTPHDSGVRLARYLTTGKEGETAALWELSGFASTDIVEAFRSVHVIAAATQCLQPFFHVQVRNPDTESLTRDQWLIVADRIERILGLAGQPRALAFHIDSQTGNEHMHLAFSRIDYDTLTARKLPFFKRRLNRVSRELESELGLTPVNAERMSTIKYAPLRPEEEQARRLNVDIRKVLETVRACFDGSDCGRSFAAALAHNGLNLAQGERRDYVVVDHAGGIHALGKRILGLSAAQIRARLADLAALPTVDQVRLRISTEEGDRKRHMVASIQTGRRRQKHLPAPAIQTRSSSRRTAQEMDDRPMRTALPAGPDPAVVQPEAMFHKWVAGPISEATIDVPIEHLAPLDLSASNESMYNPVAEPPRHLGLDDHPGPGGKSDQSAGESAGLANMLRKQFRTVVKALLKRTLSPQPKARRCGSGETIRSFELAARRLLRPIIHQPQVLKVLSFLNDAVPWIHLWSWNDDAEHETVDPAGPNEDHLSPHP